MFKTRKVELEGLQGRIENCKVRQYEQRISTYRVLVMFLYIFLSMSLVVVACVDFCFVKQGIFSVDEKVAVAIISMNTIYAFIAPILVIRAIIHRNNKNDQRDTFSSQPDKDVKFRV